MAAALRGEPQLKLQLAIGGGRLWNRLHCCWRSGTLPFSCASRFLHRIFTAARRHSSCVPPTNNITRSPTTAPTRGSLSKKSANTKHAQNGVCSGPPNQESRGLLVPFDSCTVCGECRVVIYLRPNARAARIGPWSNNNNLHIAAWVGHRGPTSLDCRKKVGQRLVVPSGNRVHKRDRTFTSTTRRRLGAGNAFPMRCFAMVALSGMPAPKRRVPHAPTMLRRPSAASPTVSVRALRTPWNVAESARTGEPLV